MHHAYMLSYTTKSRYLYLLLIEEQVRVAQPAAIVPRFTLTSGGGFQKLRFDLRPVVCFVFIVYIYIWAGLCLMRSLVSLCPQNAFYTLNTDTHTPTPTLGGIRKLVFFSLSRHRISATPYIPGGKRWNDAEMAVKTWSYSLPGVVIFCFLYSCHHRLPKNCSYRGRHRRSTQFCCWKFRVPFFIFLVVVLAIRERPLHLLLDLLTTCCRCPLQSLWPFLFLTPC